MKIFAKMVTAGFLVAALTGCAQPGDTSNTETESLRLEIERLENEIGRLEFRVYQLENAAAVDEGTQGGAAVMPAESMNSDPAAAPAPVSQGQGRYDLTPVE